MDAEIKNWLSYAVEKLSEVALVSKVFFDGEASLDEDEKKALDANKEANDTKSQLNTYS